MYNEISTYPKSKVLASAVVILALCMLVTTIPQAKAQFVIAYTYDSEFSTAFDYDEYGQGFFLYHLMTNYTYSDWNLHPDYVETFYFNQSSYLHEWTVGYSIGIRFMVWMNSTLTGAGDLTDGQDYMMLNATISTFGTELDSIEDITPFYQSTSKDPVMWLYGFDAFFNVIAESALTYTVTLTYQVYY